MHGMEIGEPFKKTSAYVPILRQVEERMLQTPGGGMITSRSLEYIPGGLNLNNHQ